MKLTDVTSKKRACLNDELENSPGNSGRVTGEDVVSWNLHNRTDCFAGLRNPLLCGGWARERKCGITAASVRYSRISSVSHLSSLSLRI